MSDLAIIVNAVKKKHPCDPVHAAIDRTVKLIQEIADDNETLEAKVEHLEEALYAISMLKDQEENMDNERALGLVFSVCEAALTTTNKG